MTHDFSEDCQTFLQNQSLKSIRDRKFLKVDRIPDLSSKMQLHQVITPRLILLWVCQCSALRIQILKNLWRTNLTRVLNDIPTLSPYHQSAWKISEMWPIQVFLPSRSVFHSPRAQDWRGVRKFGGRKSGSGLVQPELWGRDRRGLAVHADAGAVPDPETEQVEENHPGEGRYWISKFTQRWITNS